MDSGILLILVMTQVNLKKNSVGPKFAFPLSQSFFINGDIQGEPTGLPVVSNSDGNHRQMAKPHNKANMV